MTEVVLVCSPEIVATANGSGNPEISQYVYFCRTLCVLLTEDISLV